MSAEKDLDAIHKKMTTLVDSSAPVEPDGATKPVSGLEGKLTQAKWPSTDGQMALTRDYFYSQSKEIASFCAWHLANLSTIALVKGEIPGQRAGESPLGDVWGKLTVEELQAKLADRQQHEASPAIGSILDMPKGQAMQLLHNSRPELGLTPETVHEFRETVYSNLQEELEQQIGGRKSYVNAAIRNEDYRYGYLKVALQKLGINPRAFEYVRGYEVSFENEQMTKEGGVKISQCGSNEFRSVPLAQSFCEGFEKWKASEGATPTLSEAKPRDSHSIRRETTLRPGG